MKTQRDRSNEILKAAIERQNVCLKYLEDGKTVKEIAQLIGVGTSRVYQIIQRAKIRNSAKA